MSFILDALKKAEAERQRQTGPTLLEVRVSPPRRRFPLWITIIGALLVINILLLAIFVLRRPATTSAPTASLGAATSPSGAASGPPTGSPAPPAAIPAAALPAVGSPTSTTATVPTAAAPTPGTAAPGGNGVGEASEASLPNPADFTPAVPPSLAGAPSRRAADGRHEPPSLSDLGDEMPELRLDLHVYAAQPAERYALINMHRVREGDVLPEGPRVVAIDRDGVELSFRGTEFMLRPQ